VGSQCVECVKSARPPTTERVRRWAAVQGPIVTYGIVAANLGIFAWIALSGGLMGGTTAVQRNLGLYGPAVNTGDYYRILTSGFVHFGVLHVAMNMLFIWQLGMMLEPALGHVKYLLLYIAALVSGSAGALLLDPLSLTAGASGAAFGLMGAAAIALHQRHVNVLRTPIGTLLILNLVLTFAIPGISVGGHVGGLLGGALCGYIMLMPRRGTRPAWEYAVPVGVIVVATWIGIWAAGR
jgi:membrane associated rhomboid family serine protease